MTRLIDRRRRLVLETPLLIGKRPLVVLVEPGDWPFVRRGVIRVFPSRGLRFGIARLSSPQNRSVPRSGVQERNRSLRKENGSEQRKQGHFNRPDRQGCRNQVHGIGKSGVPFFTSHERDVEG